MKRLENKTVFLTGAANGIGAVTARQMVLEGARVFLVDRDQTALTSLAQTLNQLQDGAAKTAALDITDREAVKGAVDQMLLDFGQIDVLINNAGITRDALTAKMTEEAWEQVLKVNLTGPMICTQAVFPHLKAQEKGVILNASSVSSLGNIGQANYAASKSGLNALTQTWALEFARYNIRVNAVAPGFTNTALLQTIPPEVKAKIVAKVPLGRLAEPEEIAQVYCFLASDQASFITGQILYVDGGLTSGF